MVVFNIRDLEDELRPIAMYIVLNHIWNITRTDQKRRGGAVFDLVFEQEDGLETALVAKEHHAACVFDVGGFVRQHAGYSGDEIGAAQCPNLGFAFIGHLR